MGNQICSSIGIRTSVTSVLRTLEYTVDIHFINPVSGSFGLFGPVTIIRNGYTHARKFTIVVDYNADNAMDNQYERKTFRDPRIPNSTDTLLIETEIHEPVMHDPLIHQQDSSNPGCAVSTITDVAD